MEKTLVVMRHGKAMAPEQGQPDKDRSLTEAGALALGARLPHMLRLLEAGDATVQIWSSPAKRARQTARLLEAALRERNVPLKKGIGTHECLWEQDIDGFLNELRASDADFICAVGHVPFAEDVVEELAGSTPPFSTGGLCCLKVQLADKDAQDSPSASEHARLLWFAQGPIAAHWDTFVQLQAMLTSTAEVIEDRRAAFFATPEDIETIHRFRTNIRTLRSFVAFIKPWQNAQQNAETQALLKEIVGYTSRLRELDVLEKHVRATEGFSSKTCAFCKKEAAAERAHVLKILTSKQVVRAFERAMSLAKNVVWKKRYLRQGLPAKVVRARFDALIASVEADLSTLDLSDAERTHDVRKRAKRARYVAEFNEGILGADSVEIAQNMVAHQDNLGAICEARVNIGIVDSLTGEDVPEPVAWDLALLRAQNETFLYTILRESR